MLRNAEIKDLNFIHSLIIDGSKKGHFNTEFYLDPSANNGLKKSLESILTRRHRLDNGAVAYALVSEANSKPTSFMIISAIEGGKGNEIWMMGTDTEHQKKGIATYLLDSVLKQFKSGNRVVFARCESVSEVMYQLLIKKGFQHQKTSESGTRMLAYNL